MEKKQLHIVSFNIPYPADYGGIIDVFFKIKALSQAGISIILHCFEYGREHQGELEKYCDKVHYYPRLSGARYALLSLPYIVATRKSPELEKRLLADNHPILFEGLHTCHSLFSLDFASRIIIVRTHNIEHYYYEGLARIERSKKKKLFFTHEAKKLAVFEEVLEKATVIASISPADSTYFNQKYEKTFHLPAFHPFDHVSSKEGLGNYILYHADLSVGENIHACTFLLQHVFPFVDFPVIIAGRNPASSIVKLVNETCNARLVANPSDKEMFGLLQEAQICCLTTSQTTGLKLKLLSSLHSSRHCLVNNEMVENTGLEGLCHIANGKEELVSLLTLVSKEFFTCEQIEERKSILATNYSNNLNINKLIAYLVTSHYL